MILTLAFPFGAWVIGSAVVWMTPPVYRSAVMLTMDGVSGDASMDDQLELVRSGSVGREAERALQEGSLTAPGRGTMNAVSVRPNRAANLILVEVQGAGPEQARQKAMAYEQDFSDQGGVPPDAGSPSYRLDPASIVPMDASHERQIALGIGALAFLGLLLALPFLKVLERAVSLRSQPMA